MENHQKYMFSACVWSPLEWISLFLCKPTNGSPPQPFKTTANWQGLGIFLRYQTWARVWLNHEPTRDRESSSSGPHFSSPCRKERKLGMQTEKEQECLPHRSSSGWWENQDLAYSSRDILPLVIACFTHLPLYLSKFIWSSLVWNTS